VIAVYNQSGEKVESHQFSLYGTASGDEFSLQPFGFSTKRSDFASGLVYFGYRFYAPHLGRWLNRDPLQEDGGINLYAYVNGDPMGYVDPDGRSSIASPIFSGIRVGWVIGGPYGAIIGGAATFGTLCLATDLCSFNESAEDPDDITKDLIDGIEPDPYDYPTEGGEEQCDIDFDRYPGKERPTGDPKRRLKQLPDGRTINKHPSSTRPGNPPTLDVPTPGARNPNKNRTKIRYE
jgi:RHS repeat-associated protein